MTRTPTVTYPSRSAPLGASIGVTEYTNPDITWQDGSTMTWSTTGDPIEWLGAVELLPEFGISRSTPKTVFTGIGEA